MDQLNIPKSNFLRKLPKLLDKRDALHIETIRICIDAVYLDYNNLYKNLSTYNSIQYTPKRVSTSYIFKDIWSIVSNIAIIYKSLESWEKHKIKDEENSLLREVYSIRHTLHHLYERVDEWFHEQGLPLLGYATWDYIIDKNERICFFATSSLSSSTKTEMNYTFYDSHIQGGPCSLFLTAYSRVKKGEFKEHIINIVETVKLINKIHCDIEKNLVNIINDNNIDRSNGNCFYTTGFTTAIEGHVNNKVLEFGKKSAFYDYGDITEV